MAQDLESDGISRREFVKAGVTAAAVGGLALPAWAEPPDDKKDKKGDEEGQDEKIELVPTRRLGRTGIQVSMLEVGATGKETRRFRNAVYRAGVRMADTAAAYENGKHENGLGKWLAKEGKRKEFFVVSKDMPNTPDEWVKMLDKRLENFQSDYIDLFFIHGLGEPEIKFKMTPEEILEVPKSKEWAAAADKMKKSGKIKFAGFALHGEVPIRTQLLNNAAAGGWVDAIMLMYDLPTVHEHADFNKALDACHKAGVGLIAMKTGRGLKNIEKDLPTFKDLGLSPNAAVLHSVWTDERISSICSAMTNLKILRENVAAAKNFKPLKKEQMAAMLDLYKQPGRRFCAACDGRCKRAAGTEAALNDIVRYLSYYEMDGDRGRARELFARLSPRHRDWSSADLAAASHACCSKLDFETLLTRARQKLA
ncbi:MAG TPA: aldo/keto reductase [Phycisphaerae bacterium]|nr:aldo/keto reductase [Phycisphaerae bacterium]